MNWYFKKDGKSKGPFTAQQFRELARRRIVRVDDEVRRDDLGYWVRADRVKGLKFGDLEATNWELSRTIFRGYCIKLECPYCTGALVVGTDFAGQSDQCPQCTNRFLVPLAAVHEVRHETEATKRQREQAPVKLNWWRLFVRAIGIHPSVWRKPRWNPVEALGRLRSEIRREIVEFPSREERIGNRGENRVRAELGELDPREFFVFNDLYIDRPDGTGTTQIDHVVVSRFGIFVIETKNITGWIFGSTNDRQWTIVNFRQKHRSQNPIHQNRLHVSAVRAFLGLKSVQLVSVVYFVGNSQFKTKMPSNVLDQRLRSHITLHERVSLEDDEVSSCCQQLQQLVKSVDRRVARRDHLTAIHKRRRGA